MIKVMIDSKLVDFTTRLVGSGSQINTPDLTNGVMIITGYIFGCLCVFYVHIFIDIAGDRG